MNGEGQKREATSSFSGADFLKTLEDLLISLRRSSKDLAFYPSGHPQLNRSLQNAVSQVREAAAGRTSLPLTVSRTGFSFGGQPVGKENRQLATMAAELFVRRIQQISFAREVEVEELEAFLQVIVGDPKDLIEQGGPGKSLAARGVSRIQVAELDFRRVGATPAAASSAASPGSGSARPATAAAGVAGAEAEELSPGGGGSGGIVSPTQAEVSALLTPRDQALTARQGAPKEQTVESLIQRLENEAVSGNQAGYEWTASRLETAATQAIHEATLTDVLAILALFLRHQQAETLKAPVRQRAGQAVEKIASDPTMAYLVEHLRVAEDKQAHDLSALLMDLGPRAIPYVLRRLAMEDERLARDRLVAVLGRFHGMVQSHVTRAAQALGREQGSLLARTLGEIGGETSMVLLVCLFRHRDARVRGEAVRELSRIDNSSVHRVLLQALRDPDPDVLEVAISLAGSLRAKPAMPPLLRLAGQGVLSGRAFAIRKAAIAALGTMGDPATVSPLAGLLYTRTWFQRTAGDQLRLAAARALLQMSRPEAREVVVAGSRHRRGDVRRACTAALGAEGVSTPDRR